MVIDREMLFLTHLIYLGKKMLDVFPQHIREEEMKQIVRPLLFLSVFLTRHADTHCTNDLVLTFLSQGGRAHSSRHTLDTTEQMLLPVSGFLLLNLTFSIPY